MLCDKKVFFTEKSENNFFTLSPYDPHMALDSAFISPAGLRHAACDY